MIDRTHALSLTRKAEVLGISRATLYRILRDGAGSPPGAGIDFLGRTANGSRLRIQ